MKKKIWIYLSLLTIIITFAVSCGNRYIIKVSNMQPRLQYTGFSVARPPDTGWVALSYEQEGMTAMFRKELPSKTHSAFVSIKLRKLDRPATSLEDLVIIDKESHVFNDTVRFKMVNFTQTPTTLQGQWCVNWTEQVIDRNPAIAPNTPLAARAQGFRCIHPIHKSNQVVLDAEISERGLEEELDSLIIKEGEELLKSIVLESAPGVPVK